MKSSVHQPAAPQHWKPACNRGLLTACLVLVAGALAHARPLKVFILAGQSNMQGHARTHTLAQLGMDPHTAPLLAELQQDNGDPLVCDAVWISSLSDKGVKQGRLSAGFGADDDKIGPEFSFGVTVQKALQEPILIIKTAWGGKSLHSDFRPPSAGPYEFTTQQLEHFARQGKDLEALRAAKVEATGHHYRLMIEHLRQVLADIGAVCPAYHEPDGYQLAGFVWFQGWNDMVDSGSYPARDQPGGYDAYSEVLAHFIRDVRRDLEAPALPFVIGVMGVGGPVADYDAQQQRHAKVHQNFRAAMAAPAKLPEFRGNVQAVLTENCWDAQLGDLSTRQQKITRQARQQARQQGLSNREAEALREELHNTEFTEQEKEILAVGISNQAYHYLGSGRIMARIGQAFAEALTDGLLRQQGDFP